MSSRVLLVNAAYMPLALIDWMRAVGLMFQGKAEVVAEGTRVVRSPSVEIKVPLILRLASAVYPSKRKVRLSRRNVLIRDDYTCQYCGKRFPSSKLNMDHVKPRAKGGKTVWKNIVTACIKDNTRKGDKSPYEVGLKLLRQPEPPNWTLAQEIAFHLKDRIPDAWEPYLLPFMKSRTSS